jgi:ribosomal protein S18 acetylase RimI-like enzyme
VTVLEDVITYRKGRARAALAAGSAAAHAPCGLRTAVHSTASYNAAGALVVFERRLIDSSLAMLLHKPTIEIFVLYVRGVPAGFFELDTSAPRETKLCYFGLVYDFIGRRLGPYLLQAAIDQAWSRPLDRFWLHTSTFDHPKALSVYQQAGFVVYARRPVLFEDPRERGLLPRTLSHRLLPPLD